MRTRRIYIAAMSLVTLLASMTLLTSTPKELSAAPAFLCSHVECAGGFSCTYWLFKTCGFDQIGRCADWDCPIE